MPAAKPVFTKGPKMGKYWNPSQPGYRSTKVEAFDIDDEQDEAEDDEEASDLSDWESENEAQPLKRPVFKSHTEGMHASSQDVSKC